jgi:predicted GH43/DUF377 family glycosyl hydrolase
LSIVTDLDSNGDPPPSQGNGASVLSLEHAIALLEAHPTMHDDVRVVTLGFVQCGIAELFVPQDSQVVHIRIQPERIQAPFDLQYVWDYIAIADPRVNVREGISLARWNTYLHGAYVAHIGQVVTASLRS